jgi:hypothetical protein
MKLFFAALLLSMTTGMAFSQGMLDKVKSAAVSQGVAVPTPNLPSISNIAGAKDAIMAKLVPALALTAVEKPKVATDITGFLKDKAAILPLLNTDPTAYTSKFSELQGGLMGKLKTAITVAQYAKLLGLKPQVPSAGNVLSSLFF